MKRLLLNFFLFCSLLSGFNGYSQSFEDYEKEYQKGKIAYANGQYNEAIIWFDGLCAEADGNSFLPYARYFKAYSYIKLKKYTDARFVLVKLLSEVPDWVKLDEVHYLLTYAQLLDKQYVEAQTTIKGIKANDLRLKAQNMFYHFAATEKDLSSVKIAQYKLKNDKELANILAHRLSKSSDSSDVFLLKYILQDYKLNPTEFGIKGGEKKEVYTVALMLPFSLSNPRAYKNTPSLNIKDGVMFALDSLKNRGVNIEVKLFDTDKSLSKVREVLNSDGFKNVDLILGPVSGPSCVEVAKFANEHGILNFNFSREKSPSSLGSFVFSTRISYENTGKQLAKAAFKNFDSTKTVRIYYHKSVDNTDSIIAANYKKEIQTLGMKVVTFMSVEDDVTEFRKSLSAMKDSETSHVAVFASDQSLMASTLISVWEGGDKVIPVIAPKEWLEIHLINYDQFYRKNIHFYYNDYIVSDKQLIKGISTKYLEIYGVKPLTLGYIAMGYDAMMFCGIELFNHGTYFEKQMRAEGYQTLPMTAGIDLSNSDSNAIIPLLKFDEEFNFIWINKPEN